MCLSALHVLCRWHSAARVIFGYRNFLSWSKAQTGVLITVTLIPRLTINSSRLPMQVRTGRSHLAVNRNRAILPALSDEIIAKPRLFDASGV